LYVFAPKTTLIALSSNEDHAGFVLSDEANENYRLPQQVYALACCVQTRRK